MRVYIVFYLYQQNISKAGMIMLFLKLLSNSMKYVLGIRKSESSSSEKKIRYVFDLDDTVIDSNHRRRFHDGRLDLDHWIKNRTRENIFKDTLLPLAKIMRGVYLDGHEVVISTSRNISVDDIDFLSENGLLYHKVYSRTLGDSRSPVELKKEHFQKMFSERDVYTIFYEDHTNVRKMASDEFYVDSIDSIAQNMLLKRIKDLG